MFITAITFLKLHFLFFVDIWNIVFIYYLLLLIVNIYRFHFLYILFSQLSFIFFTILYICIIKSFKNFLSIIIFKIKLFTLLKKYFLTFFNISIFFLISQYSYFFSMSSSSLDYPIQRILSNLLISFTFLKSDILFSYMYIFSVVSSCLSVIFVSLKFDPCLFFNSNSNSSFLFYIHSEFLVYY